jgi:predicted phage tail protein
MAQVIADPASRWWTQAAEVAGHAGGMAAEAFSGNFKEAADRHNKLAWSSWESFTTKNPLLAWYDMVIGKERSYGEQIQDTADAKAAAAATQAANELLTDSDLERVAPEDLEAAQRRLDSIESLASAYRDQIETFGMATREAELYRLTRDAVTDADLQAVEAARELAAELDALYEAEQRQQELKREHAQALKDLDRELDRAVREQERVFQQAAKAMDRFKTPEEKYIDTVQELMKWLDMGAISVADFARAKEAAAAEIGKDIKLGKLVTVEAGEQWGATTLRDWRATQMARQQTAVDTTALDTEAAIRQFEQGRQWADTQEMGMSAEEKFQRMLEGVISELPDDEDESIDILEQIRDNTQAMAQDPGRVRVAGSF